MPSQPFLLFFLISLSTPSATWDDLVSVLLRGSMVKMMRVPSLSLLRHVLPLCLFSQIGDEVPRISPASAGYLHAGLSEPPRFELFPPLCRPSVPFETLLACLLGSKPLESPYELSGVSFSFFFAFSVLDRPSLTPKPFDSFFWPVGSGFSPILPRVLKSGFKEMISPVLSFSWIVY